MNHQSYWSIVWSQFKKSRVGVAALFILMAFFIVGLYAPFLTSSKPLLVLWNDQLYSPLLRYLFYPGYFTKPIDLFYNLLMFTLPLALIGLCVFKRRVRKLFLMGIVSLHIGLFMWILSGAVKDPASDFNLRAAKKEASSNRTNFREDPLLTSFVPQTTWSFELDFLSNYGKLNQLLRYKQIQTQHQRLIPYIEHHEKESNKQMPTLWKVWQRNETEKQQRLQSIIQETKEQYIGSFDTFPTLMEAYRPYSHAFIMAKYELEHASNLEEKLMAQDKFDSVVKNGGPLRTSLADARHIIEKHQTAAAQLNYLKDKKNWLEQESQNIKVLIPPLIRNFHWEDDAGGAQAINKYIPWWELTRINRKDLVASLLFGIRISIVVGVTAVVLSLLIGIPLGTISGYFAGKTDLVVSRFIEIWEAMPTFFMLLLVVAITQSKSIFLVITVLGIFGWTGIGRFMRSEVLKQRNLPYVLSCKTMGYTHKRVMFSHILPNAIPPILTLLPFSMMVAITSEAGLSFLGLGEEGSTSWSVLMDEGRSVFPSESYLLWPPAILLTILLISIALVGDSLRDAIDPKMRD